MELAFVAEEKALQIVQWDSNYIGEQIPSTKFVPFIGLSGPVIHSSHSLP